MVGAAFPSGGAEDEALPAPRTIAEQIADACARRIVEGGLAGGERLTEQEVADRFGVSRGPVREAFRLLERRRLVELTPRKGARVRPLSLETMAHLFDVRIALAGLAARAMAGRPRGSWHDTLARRVAELGAMAADPGADPQRFALAMTRAVRAMAHGSGNDVLVQVFEDLDEQTVWPILWRAPLDGRTPAERRARAEGMRGALARIAAGDAEGAERAMRAVYAEIRAAALAALDERSRGVATAAGGAASEPAPGAAPP